MEFVGYVFHSHHVFLRRHVRGYNPYKNNGIMLFSIIDNVILDRKSKCTIRNFFDISPHVWIVC